MLAHRLRCARWLTGTGPMVSGSPVSDPSVARDPRLPVAGTACIDERLDSAAGHVTLPRFDLTPATRMKSGMASSSMFSSISTASPHS
jgi:hypothetical protein